MAPLRSAIYQWSHDLVAVPYEILREKDPSLGSKSPLEVYLEPIVSYWLYWRIGDVGLYKTD